MQGADPELCASLSEGERGTAELSTKEERLLEFAELVTRHAYRVSDDDVQQLRKVGWADEQIAEAVYVIAMFAFFNRVADAFGLAKPAE